jgi:TolB-like protein/Tfp pilus assembly protein PilF
VASEHRIERKLAAILAADIVGYSRLAGADEDRILARLRALRSDLIDPTIAVHHGRIVKRTGDGIIVEFRSVVDAVRCAIEVQNGMVERNAGLPPERRIDFRIGLHLGDVVEETDGDLMGDGVNIAARLEGLADPGGIYLSEDAYRHVRDRVKEEFVDLGEKALKNIARPIRVYAVTTTSGAPLSVQQSTHDKSKPERLSILVLPFSNIGGDPEQEYFVDGVTESLTTDLSRIRGSFVIARNTAFTYKGKSADVKKIGRDLNVRYVMEGSVQRGGNRMRVNVQLIDAETGNHLWAERFDKPLADLFDMQDEIVARLANSLSAQLVAAEARRAERALNPDSMDLYFQGKACANKGITTDNLESARRLYEQALTRDPDNVDALAGIAAVHSMTVINYLYGDERASRFASAIAAATKAISLAPEHALAHYYLGMMEIYSRNTARGIARCKRALELDRNLATAHLGIGIGKIYIGRCEETEADIREAFRLSPQDTNAYLWLAVVGYTKVHLGSYEEAVAWLVRSMETGHNYALPHFYLAVALANLDRLEEASSEVRAGLDLDPTFTVARFRAAAWSGNETYLAQRERIYDGMRKAGLPER